MIIQVPYYIWALTMLSAGLALWVAWLLGRKLGRAEGYQDATERWVATYGRLPAPPPPPDPRLDINS